MDIESFPENVLAPVGTGDDDVHQDQYQIVMPSESLFSPEAFVPNKDFPLDCSQHDQNQTNRRELREYTKREVNQEGGARQEFCSSSTDYTISSNHDEAYQESLGHSSSVREIGCGLRYPLA